MKDSIVLHRNLAYGLLKAAITTGDIQLAVPETVSEKDQVAQFQMRINRSRSDQAALAYCLLADTIYLDGAALGGWHLFADLDSEVDCQHRPLIARMSDNVMRFIHTSDSSSNYMHLHDSDPHMRANVFGSLEPLIWDSFKRNNPPDRQLIRNSLDLIILEPDLVLHHRNLDAGGFNQSLLKATKRKWPKRNVDGEFLRFCSSLTYLTLTKGCVAANLLTEVQRLDAIWPVPELSFGHNRYSTILADLPGIKSQNIVAAVRLFLEEVEYWPAVSRFSDILRLREDSHFIEFRSHLKRWVDAVLAGDPVMEAAIRKEIARANSALRRATNCSKIGRFFTYIGLPLLVIDALTLPVLGTSATIAGFALQALADWQTQKGKWLIVGQ